MSKPPGAFSARGVRVLGSSLAACAAVSGIAAWIDAFRVTRGAIPPVPWDETAALSARGGVLLAAPLIAVAILVWLVSSARAGSRAAQSGSVAPRPSCDCALTLTSGTLAAWLVSLALLVASGFSVKIGWVAGVPLAGAVTGWLITRSLSRRTGSAMGGTRRRIIAGAVAAVAFITWGAMAVMPQAGAVAPAAGPIASPDAGKGAVRPNILFILIDTLRADHLGCYGYGRPTSPVIDRLAAAAWRFEEAVAPSSWTLPAMASILTSSYPGQHGVVDRGDALPRDLDDLAGRLSASGYNTVAFNTNPWLKRAFHFDDGFSLYHDLDRLSLAKELLGVRLKNMALRRLGRIRLDPELVPEAEEITARAEAWLDARAPQPFFLYLHYMDVHAPYDPPAPYRGHFCRDHRFELPDHSLESRFRAGRFKGDAAVLDHVIELYDEDIMAMDAAVGRLLAFLDSAALGSSTHVIITADHGEEFYEHGRTTHGSDLYQETLRVPLIIARAGERSGGVITRRVSTLDVYPTILDLAGIAPPVSIEGDSLLPLMNPATLMEGAGSPPRPIGSQLFHDGRAWSALFAGGDKLIRVRPPATDPASASALELYHLDRDPSETANAAAVEPALTSALASALDGYEKGWGIAGSGGGRPGEPLDPETLRQLKALGYIK